MKIQQNAFVAIDYILTNDDGEVVDKSEEGKPLGFIYGRGQIIPGLEKALNGMTTNDSSKIRVAPADGYGDVNDELFQEIPRENFPAEGDIEQGQQFQANTPHGPMRFVVREVKDDCVIVDLNHPLAGQFLNFDVKVAEVREATEEELAPPVHSHCDGSHGCGSCG